MTFPTACAIVLAVTWTLVIVLALVSMKWLCRGDRDGD